MRAGGVVKTITCARAVSRLAFDDTRLFADNCSVPVKLGSQHRSAFVALRRPLSRLRSEPHRAPHSAQRPSPRGVRRGHGLRRHRSVPAFAVDPESPAYGIVVDIGNAPRNDAGLVEYIADFCIIRPVDLSRGNRRLFYDVNNRGNPRMLRFFNDAVHSNARQVDEHAGSGFLRGARPGLVGLAGRPAPRRRPALRPGAVRLYGLPGQAHRAGRSAPGRPATAAGGGRRPIRRAGDEEAIFVVQTPKEFQLAKHSVASELYRGAKKGLLQKVGGNRCQRLKVTEDSGGLTKEIKYDPPLNSPDTEDVAKR